MDGEGGAFLFLLGNFSQDSNVGKNEGFLGGKGMIFPFFFTF